MSLGKKATKISCFPNLYLRHEHQEQLIQECLNGSFRHASSPRTFGSNLHTFSDSRRGKRKGGYFYFSIRRRSPYFYPISHLSLSEVTEFSLSLFSAIIFVINSSAVSLSHIDPCNSAFTLFISFSNISFSVSSAAVLLRFTCNLFSRVWRRGPHITSMSWHKALVKTAKIIKKKPFNQNRNKVRRDTE